MFISSTHKLIDAIDPVHLPKHPIFIHIIYFIFTHWEKFVHAARHFSEDCFVTLSCSTPVTSLRQTDGERDLHTRLYTIWNHSSSFKETLKSKRCSLKFFKQ